MHRGQDWETSEQVGKATTPQKCSRPPLRASQSRPPEFTRGMVGGSRGDGKTTRHLAGKEHRCLLDSRPAQSAQEEDIYKQWLFWALHLTQRQEAGWS